MVGHEKQEWIVKFSLGRQGRDPVRFVVFRVFYYGDIDAAERALGKPVANLVGAITDDYHKSRNSGLQTRRDYVLEKWYAAQGHQGFGNAAGHRCNPTSIAGSENLRLPLPAARIKHSLTAVMAGPP